MEPGDSTPHLQELSNNRVLSQINPIPRIYTYLFKIHSSIVLLSMHKNTAPWWFEKQKNILGAKGGGWRSKKMETTVHKLNIKKEYKSIDLLMHIILDNKDIKIIIISIVIIILIITITVFLKFLERSREDKSVWTT